MRHVKRKFIVENTWNCSSCGHSNLGRYTQCQNCGSPKEKEEHYNPADPNGPEIKDAERLRMARAGANRHCPYCEADIREFEEICPSCAATRNEHNDETVTNRDAEAEWLRQMADVEEEAGGFPLETGVILNSVRPKVTEKHSDHATVSLPKRRNPWRVAAFIALWIVLSGCLVFGGIWLFKTWEVNAAVNSVSWRQTATLFQRQQLHGQGWEGTVPISAFNESCERRQNGTENCHPQDCRCHMVDRDCNCQDCRCHTSCSSNANGFSECEESCDTCCDNCPEEVCDTCYDQCPVYDNWCSYDYYEWSPLGSNTTHGNTLLVQSPDIRAVGSEQRVELEEHYEVIFRNGDESWTYHPSNLSEFQQFSGLWRVKVNRFGLVFPQKRLSEE